MKTTFTIFLLTIFLLVGCGTSADTHADHAHETTLPTFSAVNLNGRQLNVVVTTSLIGDVVSNIGGDAISLSTLISPNQDVHSYEATPNDLVTLEQADIIFINGWDLEEQLAKTIEENYADKAVSISTDVEPIEMDGADDEHGHGHGSDDPHVWFSIHNVEQWARTSAEILHTLDPENESTYETNRDSYLAELATLETDVDALLSDLPTDQRKLVTNHDSFAYLARDYEFEVVGTVIPAASTSAEPSASDLADLVTAMTEENICTIFAELSNNSSLAEVVSAELNHCPNVQVIPLHTGSLGDGETSTYIGLFRSNIKAIVDGLSTP